MTTNIYRILIGANGWLHPAWQTTFYPDDLPDDWQLGYYSNEFPIVLMPAAYWQKPDEEIAAWLEDSADSLRLICEVPPEYLQGQVDESAQSIKRFIQRISILGEHCVGLLISISNEQIDIKGLLEQIPLELPLCIDLNPELSVDYAKSIQKVCEKQGVGLCWHGTESPNGLTQGQLALTRINSKGMDMRQLRHVVETVLEQTSPQQTSIIIVDGTPPELDAIRHMGVILDLF